MQRLVLAVILALVVVALVSAALRHRAGRSAQATTGTEVSTRAPMAKIAFFLLLCVMAYAIVTGAG